LAKNSRLWRGKVATRGLRPLAPGGGRSLRSGREVARAARRAGTV